MNQVSVMSHNTVGGKQRKMTRKSAMAKLTMNMLVTLRKGKRNHFFVLLLKTQCLVV